MLAEIYGWFTEGFDTLDLQEAKALLEAEGIEAMGGEGEPFDPQTQQAISYEDTDDGEGGDSYYAPTFFGTVVRRQ